MSELEVSGIGNLVAKGSISRNTITINNTVNYVLGQSADYTQWQTDKTNYELLVSLLPEGDARRGTISLQIEELNQKMASYENTVRNLAKMFSETKIDSERGNQARILFESGKIKEAQEILNEQEIKNEYKSLIKSIEEKQEELENEKKKITELSQQLLFKAELTLLDYENSKRLEIAEKYYKDSISMHACYSTLNSYVEFLTDQLRYKDEAAIYEEMLSLKEEIPSVDRVRILHNLAIAYSRLGESERVFDCFSNLISNISYRKDNEPLDTDEILSSILMANTLQTAVLDEIKRAENIDYNLIECLIKFKSIIVQLLPHPDFEKSLLPLSAKTFFNISDVLVEKGVVDKSSHYLTQSIDAVKLYLDDPAYPTIFHPNDLVLSLAAVLKKLAISPEVEKAKTDHFSNEIISLADKYEKLISEKETKQDRREKLFLSISMTYFYLCDVSKEKEYELLKKAFSFNGGIERSSDVTHYFFQVFGRLYSLAFDSEEYEFLYNISKEIEKLFPYMILDEGETNFKEAILNFIAECEKEPSENEMPEVS